MLNNFILRVDCADRPGIVAAVANALVAAGCNIEDAAQFSDRFSGRFFMRVVFRPLVAAEGSGRFTDAFSKIATAYDMTWDVRPAGQKVRALVMVSQHDHCLNDLLYRCRTGQLNIDIPAIVSNHDSCASLVKNAGIPFHHLPVTQAAKSDAEGKLAALVDETESEIIVLARYMQVLSDDFCRKYAGRYHQHPPFLPPRLQGREAVPSGVGARREDHRRHRAIFVTADLDEGPIIEQQIARVTHAATPEDMVISGRDVETQVLARALSFYAARRIFLHGNRTVIL